MGLNAFLRIRSGLHYTTKQPVRVVLQTSETMPKVTRRSKLTASSLKEAIDLVQSGELTVRSAASQFSTPKCEHAPKIIVCVS